MGDSLKVRFWGVRGSISCSGPEYVRYGGNTSCLEVMAGGRRLIFDAGTGIRALGLELVRKTPLDLDIYFTHTHLDHISGLTFFSPLYDKRNSVRLWAGHLESPYTLKKVVSNLMQAPIYPVTLDIFQASVSFTEFKAGDVLSCGQVSMRTAALNHPNGPPATASSMAASRSATSPTPSSRGRARQGIAAVPRRRPDDLRFRHRRRMPATKAGRHYSGKACGWPMAIGTLAIFHHDPSHHGAFMDDVACEAAALRPGTAAGGLPRADVAHEGLTLSP